MAQVEGRTVIIGDIVNFKSDVEQWGKINKIDGQRLVLESVHETGFEGDYIGGNKYHTVLASECWLD